MLHSPSPYGPEDKLGRAFYHGARADSPTLDFDEACIRTAEAWLADGLPEPWLLYVPLFFPHPPFEVEEPWFSLHDRADVPLPSPGPVAGDAPLFKRLVHERYGLARLDEDDWREIVATYYGMVSRIDAHLGRLLAGVEASGAMDRTAVLFFPDHGEYLGDFGLIEKWVSGMDPCLLHNPLIVAVPDGPAAVVAEGLVELVDVAPTLCELAEIDPPPRQFGRSLLSGAPREAAFSEGGLAVGDASPEPVPFPYDLKHALEAEVPVTAGKVAAIRTAEWTYVHRVLEGPELYDRVADPSETSNLASDPAHASVLASLREQLLTWMVDTADVRGPVDPRFDPEGALMP
jgi:arylsulfatase A-like enzyme